MNSRNRFPNGARNPYSGNPVPNGARNQSSSGSAASESSERSNSNTSRASTSIHHNSLERLQHAPTEWSATASKESKLKYTLRGIFKGEENLHKGVLAHFPKPWEVDNDDEIQGPKCEFCIQNGEANVGHKLKDEQGRTICPVLVKFRCKICNATGASAHTEKYCPLNPLTNGDPVASGLQPGLQY